MPMGVYRHKSSWNKGKKNPELSVRNKINNPMKSLKSRKKSSDSHKGKKQSKETIEKRVSQLRGKKHWNWKGGINTENERLRHSLEWTIWRNSVYERDSWTCRLCEIKCGKNIIAHHLKLFSKYPELRFSIDNGITLCRSCHARVHSPNRKAKS